MAKKRYYHNGKRVSKGEKKIAVFLESKGIQYIPEKTFNNCLSPRGRCLRFDFYIESHNLLIEFDGEHHTRPVNKYKRALIVHRKTKKHDAIKNYYANSNNIRLVRIPYWDIENIEEILEPIFMGDMPEPPGGK